MILQHPLIPRNPDGILRVFIPGRISTPGQDVEAIATTQEDVEAWLAQVYRGETKVTRVSEQASGWLADRKSMRKIQTAIEANECDLVVVREARELYRNPRFFWAFFQDCADDDVRVISVWDGVDTANDDWEFAAHVASLKSGIQVPEIDQTVTVFDYGCGRGEDLLLLAEGGVGCDGCGRAYLGEVEGANLLKIHRRTGKISYLVYPDFDTDPHPALFRCVKLNLRTRQLECYEYAESKNPPVLHRKETFLDRDDERRAKFARLTTQEEKHGLLADTSSIGTRDGWNRRLCEKGFTLRGHRIYRTIIK